MDITTASGGVNIRNNRSRTKVMDSGRDRDRERERDSSTRVSTRGGGGDAGGGSSIYGPHAGRYSDGMKIRQANLMVGILPPSLLP